MTRREAARDREASPDVVKLPGGGDVMGGDDSFAAARAAQQARSVGWARRSPYARSPCRGLAAKQSHLPAHEPCQDSGLFLRAVRVRMWQHF